MRRPWRPHRRLISVLALTATALSVLAVACGGSYEDPLEPFNQAIDTFNGPFKGASSVEVFRPGRGKPQGYIKGGVVLLEGKRLSLYHDNLPDKLRAATPDDVGTVVLIKESNRKVGTYTGGEPAYETVWSVSVVDLRKARVIGRALLQGDRPPFLADISAGENYGPPPWEELVRYLRRLARR